MDQKAAGLRQNEAHDKVVGAERDLSHGRTALAAAMGELVTQAAVFELYTQGDLRPLLEVTESAPWPAAGQWPDPQRVGDELVDRLMAGDDAAGEGTDPEEVIREVLPGAAATVLDAFVAATRAGGVGPRGRSSGAAPESTRRCPHVVGRPEPVLESHRGHSGRLGRRVFLNAVVRRVAQERMIQVLEEDLLEVSRRGSGKVTSAASATTSTWSAAPGAPAPGPRTPEAHSPGSAGW